MSLLKMLSLIYVALLYLTSCSVVQQETTKIRPPHSGLFPITQDGKFGYIDSSGKVIISPQFEYGNEFYEDLAQVAIGGKFGFIDKSGKVVITPQFSSAAMFSEGLAFVQVDKKTGVIDKTGKFVVNPQFDTYNPIDLEKFSSGVAPVRVGDKVGYIDTTGKLVINPQFLIGNSFSEGLAQVVIGDRDEEGYKKENVKCGYIDNTGKFAINPQFVQCQDFVGGLAIAGQGTIRSFKTVVINKTGEIVIDGNSFHAKGIFLDGLLIACKQHNGIKQNCGFVDNSGNWVIQPQYDRAEPFSEGLAAVTFVESEDNKNKKGYIDKTGKIVINPQFREAGLFWGGLARVEIYNSGKTRAYGYIDKTGKFVWNPTNERKSYLSQNAFSC